MTFINKGFKGFKKINKGVLLNGNIIDQGYILDFLTNEQNIGEVNHSQ